MAKIMQLAKDLLKGGNKEDIYPKTVDTAVAAETVGGEESTVDQVYLKTANLNNLVINLPAIKDLIDRAEPNILSVEVSTESTEYEGDIIVNSITYNKEPPTISTVNDIINLILNNSNIKLQLYRYNSSRTAKIDVIELDMATYGSETHIIGYKFLEGKRLLIIDDLVHMVTEAITGQGEATHYKAISLDSTHIVLINLTTVGSENRAIFVNSSGEEVTNINFEIIQNWLTNGDTVILRHYASKIDFYCSSFSYGTRVSFSRAYCSNNDEGGIQTLHLSRNRSYFTITECYCNSMKSVIDSQGNITSGKEVEDIIDDVSIQHFVNLSMDSTENGNPITKYFNLESVKTISNTTTVVFSCIHYTGNNLTRTVATASTGDTKFTITSTTI